MGQLFDISAVEDAIECVCPHSPNSRLELTNLIRKEIANPIKKTLSFRVLRINYCMSNVTAESQTMENQKGNELTIMIAQALNEMKCDLEM